MAAGVGGLGHQVAALGGRKAVGRLDEAQVINRDDGRAGGQPRQSESHTVQQRQPVAPGLHRPHGLLPGNTRQAVARGQARADGTQRGVAGPFGRPTRV